jgi:hypothetical protein
MSPVSGISNNAVKEVPDMEAFLIDQRSQGYSIVFVDENAPATLSEFDHPVDNVVYVFGKASLSPMIAFSKPEDKSIKIPTKSNLGLLWPHQVAVLILNDRFVKGL